MIKTEIGYTTPTKITVRGMDLAEEIIGKFDFVEAFVLCAMGRLPSPEEKNMLNAILVVGLDHGLTPSAISARMTFLGAPEALQGAVAAGLLGAGTRLLGTSERASRQFLEFSEPISASAPESENAAIGQKLVDTRLGRGETLFGYGHPIHKVADPRVATLREIAKKNGFYKKNWLLADEVADILMRREKPLSMNASAAMGATIADMGLNPSLGVALMLVGRCGGLIAHIFEEQENPIAGEVWKLLLQQDERNELPES